MNQSENIAQLLQQQLALWPLAQSNYQALQRVKTKTLSFGNYSIQVQFNPERLQSSAAKIDTKSIQERKCFLCPANLPEVQRGLAYGSGYQILVNPYPIFPNHYTIPSYTHQDQLIASRYGDMLDLAKDLDSCTIFYNGPKCGASAPDHLHFQAGSKGFMPIEKEIERISKETLIETKRLKVSVIADYLRNGICIETSDRTEAVAFFDQLYALLPIKEGETEPMMNILSWYKPLVQQWISCIFPRAQHRPACFSDIGDKNILISPASVDLGGVFITPLEKDFDKINACDIEQILNEVCISTESLQLIINKIQK